MSPTVNAEEEVTRLSGRIVAFAQITNKVCIDAYMYRFLLRVDAPLRFDVCFVFQFYYLVQLRFTFSLSCCT